MLRSAALAALLGAGSVLAAQCSLGRRCPQDSPCCSQYGECGVGAFCLGGCDPRMSFSLDSCTPAPVCEDKTMKFDSLDSIVDIGNYLGDPSKADWVSQGEPAAFDGNVLLTMPKDSVGTVLASTRYLWYGNIKAKFKTSRGRGVVTAFIMLSDVKDEIDYEFVGADLQTAQTNFYFQGIPNYHNSGNISLSDTFSDFHEYEVRWTPDSIQWLVDGQVGRTVNRKDTWNATSNQWDYPQTPARVQLSIWPGGLASNAPGTIAWAGGEIDWNAEDIRQAGYFYATFAEVTVECFNAKTAPGTNSGKSYTYNSFRGTNDTVVDGDKDTVLASLDDSGLDMDAGKETQSSVTSSADKPKNTQAQIPGGSSGGVGQNHGDDGGDKGGSSGSGSSGSGSSGSGSSGSGSSPPSGGGGGGGGNGGSGSSGGSSDTSGCDVTSFNQNCNSGSSGSSSSKNSGTRTGASILAVVFAGFVCSAFAIM